MSKGLGWVEVAIQQIMRDNPDRAYLIDELARAVYKVLSVQKKHHVSLHRAVQTLCEADPEIEIIEYKRRLVVYNRKHVRSYGMAVIKLMCRRPGPRRTGRWDDEALAQKVAADPKSQEGGEWWNVVHKKPDPEQELADLKWSLMMMARYGCTMEDREWAMQTFLELQK